MRLTLYDSEQTIEQLFDDHFHHLVLSAMRYVNDYHQAEDIVQDVFVKVWQNFDDIKQIEDLKGYLFKAVKNSSLNYQRSLKVKQKFNTESEHTDQIFERSTEELCMEAETQSRILQAVNKLPKHWHEAFIMSRYDNLRYHEIADKLNISQKTVEKYISKSLLFLRNELRDLLITVGILLLNKLF